jgi:uncharacterized membrane-anchored protein YhcB (DUF1043 family)
MALPFILGVAVGAGAVIAYNNSQKIQDKTSEVFEKSKDVVADVKNNVESTVGCIKEKVTKKDSSTCDEKKEEKDIDKGEEF